MSPPADKDALRRRTVQGCQPSSIEPLDSALASLRATALSYLEELEVQLANLESAGDEAIATALDLLAGIRDGIREDVSRMGSTLSDHIQGLHTHLSSIQLPPETSLAELIEILRQLEDDASVAAKDIASAIARSFHGVRLISYHDLPPAWRNNPYVIGGYRFIPLERWPLIARSLFTCHNETLNIHTHLIPAILWAITTFAPQVPDGPEFLFMAFALLCLFTSSLWHTMAGCAHHASMEFCARVDYVGIGWLISASVGTVVYYGFQCHPTLGKYLLLLSFLSGLAGNIVPFTYWFNEYKYRVYRVVFFLSLVAAALTPLFVLAHLHSPAQVLSFIAPVGPSLLSYIIGLLFYVSHIPERWCSDKWKARLDMVGGGSHCIWHCFIVLAVSQHRAAIQTMKGGLGCQVS